MYILYIAPLYPGALMSSKESTRMIYEFSISNRLTDSGTQELLNLIRNHCPTPNSIPTTTYRLKKQIGQSDCFQSQYCSVCLDVVERTELKCSKCNNDQLCYLNILQFEEHLQEIFSGKFRLLSHCFI